MCNKGYPNQLGPRDNLRISNSIFLVEQGFTNVNYVNKIKKWLKISYVQLCIEVKHKQR